MIQTLNKHIRWRKDKKDILICDCKRLIDLKTPLKFESFMKRLERGVEKEKLDGELKKVFSDFEKMKLLSKLEIRKIQTNEFENIIKIMDDELGENRVRGKEFLYKKFKEYPEFFIGIFLDNEIIGMICGFPRDDYLLLSELAVAFPFQNRGFGGKLVKKFESIAKNKYDKINVGADDKSIYFYESLKYEPFLLIQFKKDDYSRKDFYNLNIIREYEFDSKNIAIEVKTRNPDLELLNKLRKKYPKAHFQYIFTKEI